MLQGALSRKDTQRMVGSFSHFYHQNLILGILTIGYFFIVSTLSIPARLLLRKNFGERTISIPSFLLSLAVYSGFTLILFLILSSILEFGLYKAFMETFARVLQSFQWSRFFLNLFFFLLSPFTILIVLLFYKALVHFRSHLKNYRSNIAGYSFYRGESIRFNNRKGGKIFGFNINERILRMIVEPLALSKISLLLFALSIASIVFRSLNPAEGIIHQFIDCLAFGILAVSVTLILSSISLFFEEFSIMQKSRDAILDMIDGELDMQKILSIKENLKIQDYPSSDSNFLN